MLKITTSILKIRLLLLALFLPMAIMVCSFQEGKIQDVNVVKSLFIYNFTKHIEWPDQKINSSKFRIAIFGNPAISAKLTAILKDRKIIDKPVEIYDITTIEESFNANLLFIANGQGDKLNTMLDKCNGKSILIITEEKRLNSHGGSINIYERDSHIRFELNEMNIKKEGFKVSNQLYELASTNR